LIHKKFFLALLLFKQQSFPPFQEPLRISLNLIRSDLLSHTALVGLVFPFLQLLLVGLLVHAVHLAHLLNFVEVNNKASLVSVVFFDALTAKDSEVIGAIEVLHSLLVFITKKTVDAIIVFKVDVPQNTVSLDNLIKDVEVER
jgi:hypothetical protein